MNLVDEQHRVRVGLELLEHRLESLLEVAAVFGTRQQSTHVERKHGRLGQHFRHIALGDTPSEAFGNRGLAYPSFADEQRIVLAPAAQHLNDALDFGLATNQWVDAPFTGRGIEVGRELLERTLLSGRLILGLLRRLFLGRLFRLRRLGDAM